MQKSTHVRIQLPAGNSVFISDTPEAWWSTDGASGYVDPTILAPDPDQPRKFMRGGKLDELRDSIAERGVRQAITVTPRTCAPWVTLSPKHRNAYFVIVSGHRRAECARATKLGAVPIQVVIYPNENEHRTDAGLLNACRDDLSELEEGFEFVRLRDTGATVESIRKAWGYKSAQQVFNRINLTKLHPDLQKLTVADANGIREISITVAGILGGVKAPNADELDTLATNVAGSVDAHKVTGYDDFEHLADDDRRFAMQKILVAVIKKRNLSAVRAGELIRDLTLSFGGAKYAHDKTERYQPARRRELLKSLLKEVQGSVIVDWRREEFRRIFELVPYEEVEKFEKELHAAADVLTGIAKILESLRRSKRPTHPEVQKLMASRTAKSNA